MSREEVKEPGLRPEAEIRSGQATFTHSVRGGEIVVVAPSETPEEEAIGASTRIRGTLRLDNERVLSFEIGRGSTNASFSDAPGQLPPHRPVGEPGARPHIGRGFGTRGVTEIMTRDVLVASPDMLVEDVAKLLAFHNISGMPVEDGVGELVGIVSEADVIGKLGVIVDDVMSTEIISVTEDTPIEEVAKIMTDLRIRRVPVLAGGNLVGIVSRADIVRALAG